MEQDDQTQMIQHIDKYIEQYGQRLYGLCVHLTGNCHDADDLYQETWLKVLRFLTRYDPARDFGPWLTSICVNTYRDLRKKRWRSPFFDLFRDSEEKDAVMERQPDRKPEYKELREAVESLEEKLRITVILYYFCDMNQMKTAQVLGIPVGTVKSRLNLARKKLKEVMTDEG